MIKPYVVIAVLAVLLAAALPARAELSVGDPAPKFTIDTWLEGAAEDPAAGKGEKIYVLDFWATWCLPCIYQMPELAEFQRAYRDQGVVVIGVTGPVQGQQLEQVRQFLKARPGGVGYTIGWDSSMRMWDNFLTAAGSEGIPYLFVIGRDGRIAYHGYESPKAKDAVNDLVAGTFDMERAVARAQNEPKIRQKFAQLNLAVMMKNWTQATALLDEVLELDPTNEQALMWGYQIRVNEMGPTADVRAWVQAFIDKHSKDTASLAAMARLLMMIEEPGERLPDLMLRAARGAHDAGGGKDAEATEIYARAAFRVGHLDEAIRLQTLAVESAPKHRQTALAKTLAYYRTCRKLRDSEF
ncbi:MAG TPA: TlpA disulfide reductase family protein [Phycisphaerae bacterium]|nr:TlpA disulfide reductase family protein [Phycisphaerae bacterium]